MTRSSRRWKAQNPFAPMAVKQVLTAGTLSPAWCCQGRAVGTGPALGLGHLSPSPGPSRSEPCDMERVPSSLSFPMKGATNDNRDVGWTRRGPVWQALSSTGAEAQTLCVCLTWS